MVLEYSAAQADAVQAVAPANAATDLGDGPAEGVVKAGGDLCDSSASGDILDDGRQGWTKIDHDGLGLLEIVLVAIRDAGVCRHLQGNRRLSLEGDLGAHAKQGCDAVET